MTVTTETVSHLLDVPPISADVYIELSTHTTISIGRLQKLLEISEKDIKNALNNLESKGLVHCRIDTSGKKQYRTTPITQLKKDWAYRGKNYQKDIVSTLKKIVFPKSFLTEDIQIMKYEGWEGIRKVYEEVLEEAKNTGEDIYAFESNRVKSNIGKDFLEDYIQRRIEYKIQAHVISPCNEQDKSYKKNYEGLYTKVKLIEKLSIDANINVVGSLVMTFSTDRPQGTLRRNRAEANSLRSLFHALWKTP